MDNYENDGWGSPITNNEPTIPKQENDLNEQPIISQEENNVNVQEAIPQEINFINDQQENMNVIQQSLPQDMYDIIGQQPLPQQPKSTEGLSNDSAKNFNKKPIIIVGILLLFAVIIVILYLTGIIGSKKLVCTQSDTSSIVKMTREMNLKFKRDAVYRVDATMTIDLGEYASEKETYLKAFKEFVEDFKKDGVDSTLTSDDSKIYITFTAKNNNFISFGIKEDSKYENIKEMLENDGYTCK